MDDLQQIPQLELEAAIMAALLSGQSFETAQKYITSNCFTSEAFRKIYDMIKIRVEEGRQVDAVSLLCEDGIDIGWYVTLKEGFVGSSNFEWRCQLLAKRHLAFKLRTLLMAAAADSSIREPNSLMVDIQSQFESLQMRPVNEWASLNECLDESTETFDQRCADNGNVIFSGVGMLDEIFSAIHNSRLVVIAARPGVGKTALAQQIALQSAMKGKKIAVISMEMSKDELGFRAIANVFDLNVTKISQGNFEEYNKYCAHHYFNDFRNLPIYVKDDIYKLDQIISSLVMAKKQLNIDFAIIDHIGLIEADGFNNRNDMMGRITRSLKQLTKRISMPIVALSQLNRQGDADEAIPHLSWLRDSGNIEQDADMVMFMQRSGEMHNDGSFLIRCVVAKNRNGKMGTFGPIKFMGMTQKFISYEAASVCL